MTRNAPAGRKEYPFLNQSMYHTLWLYACSNGARLVCNHETSSGVWVAAFTVCSYLPQFLISFIGGVWADRYHRKKLIIGADLLIAFVTFVMVLAIPHISSEPALLGGLLVMSSYDPWGQEYKLQRSMPLSHSLSQKISLCGTTASMQQCSLLLILRLQRRQVQFLQSAH